MTLTAEFYILQFSDYEQALLFTCQLTEKKFDSNNKLYICVDNAQQAERLDLLLWTFKDISFLPHSVMTTDKKICEPILIGWGEQAIPPVDKLINLCTTYSPVVYPCSEITEIVIATTNAQQTARERYKQYREQGYALSTHKINQPAATSTATHLKMPSVAI